ncbi:MAG: fructosamine kinase family protein [Sedimenticola sp.]|nr:fructosamine kinase family protein [Sedimenticola sp.]
MNHALADALLEQISQTTGTDLRHCTTEPIGGGCINQAFKLTAGSSSYFVKINRADRLAMFEREAEGLKLLASTHSLRTPGVVCAGETESTAYLVLEYIQMGGPDNAETAGRQLALLHQTTASSFGNSNNNFIGSSRQINRFCDSWTNFWQQHRLGYQLKLAKQNGYHGRLQSRGEQLQAQLPALLDHKPAPSLVHGDLWSGNLGYATNGEPVIFDPAVYYGDRETDLAMSELFGGFSDRFYAAYNEAWPLPPGYPLRKTLYNLYHILNHLNLFGGGYQQQALAMMERLLAEVR